MESSAGVPPASGIRFGMRILRAEVFARIAGEGPLRPGGESSCADLRLMGPRLMGSPW
jgi:hypothetical protein